MVVNRERDSINESDSDSENGRSIETDSNNKIDSVIYNKNDEGRIIASG